MKTLSTQLAELPDDDLVLTIGDALMSHPTLRHRSGEVTEMLRFAVQEAGIVAGLAGPARRVHSGLSDVFTQARIEAEARRTVLAEEMLSSTAVSKALGAAGGNTRDAASARRARGELLGIPQGSRYVYPAFQLDPLAKRVVPVVAAVNRHLGAHEDPWGVASWWISGHPRLGDAAPKSLVGTEREGELLVLAGLPGDDALARRAN